MVLKVRYLHGTPKRDRACESTPATGSRQDSSSCPMSDRDAKPQLVVTEPRCFQQCLSLSYDKP
ncbi:hypothetical protein AS9A_3638 [Hoyosella subflava DQS3-9A1]|uniref:Uncharacterized protein n=1 Tax=Hoyosella subflava (strain DSM 45089 / JCM 17490 / NBRC 109087 / DQS3-9A1) TaxID=443218 RepID=F6ES72_HOYSD|nr:hypothetical protein AS9A_3638 [Hoyosella subflava DQS3-9A1]